VGTARLHFVYDRMFALQINHEIRKFHPIPFLALLSRSHFYYAQREADAPATIL